MSQPTTIKIFIQARTMSNYKIDPIRILYYKSFITTKYHASEQQQLSWPFGSIQQIPSIQLDTRSAQTTRIIV